MVFCKCWLNLAVNTNPTHDMTIMAISIQNIPTGTTIGSNMISSMIALLRRNE